MATDVYTTFGYFHEFAVSQASVERKRQLKLFPVSGPSELVATDSLGLLLNATTGSHVIIVMKNWYGNPAKAILSLKTTAPHVASTFYNQWVVPYRIFVFQLTDDEPKFLNNYF